MCRRTLITVVVMVGFVAFSFLFGQNKHSKHSRCCFFTFLSEIMFSPAPEPWRHSSTSTRPRFRSAVLYVQAAMLIELYLEDTSSSEKIRIFCSFHFCISLLDLWCREALEALDKFYPPTPETETAKESSYTIDDESSLQDGTIVNMQVRYFCVECKRAWKLYTVKVR